MFKFLFLFLFLFSSTSAFSQVRRLLIAPLDTGTKVKSMILVKGTLYFTIIPNRVIHDLVSFCAYDLKSNSLNVINPPEKIQNYPFEKLTKNQEDQLWAYTAQGHIMEVSSKKITSIRGDQKQYNVSDVHFDQKYMWVATTNTGIKILKKDGSFFTKEDTLIKESYPFSNNYSTDLKRDKKRRATKKIFHDLPTKIVYGIVGNGQNKLIATEEGLFTFVFTTKEKPYFELVLDSNTFVLKEFEEKVWVGGYNKVWFGNGTKWTSLKVNKGFENVRDLEFDKDGNLWILSNILLKYDFKTKKTVFFDEKTDPEFKSKFAYSLEIDKETNEVWIGTEGSGVLRLKEKNNSDSSLLAKKEIATPFTSVTIPKVSDIVIKESKNFKAEFRKDTVVFFSKQDVKKRDSIIFSQNYEVKNLLFETDKWNLTKDSEDTLDQLAEKVKLIQTVYSNFKIEIEGHTAKALNSDPKVNQLLSESRAKSVLRYLRDRKGIPKEKMSTKGYGFEKLKHKEMDKNQRVELKFSIK